VNEKQQRNNDLQERLIEFAGRVLDVFDSLPNSIPCFPLPFITPRSIFDIPSYSYAHGERIAQQYNHRPARRPRGKYPITNP